MRSKYLIFKRIIRLPYINWGESTSNINEYVTPCFFSHPAFFPESSQILFARYLKILLFPVFCRSSIIRNFKWTMNVKQYGQNQPLCYAFKYNIKQSFSQPCANTILNKIRHLFFTQASFHIFFLQIRQIDYNNLYKFLQT